MSSKMHCVRSPKNSTEAVIPTGFTEFDRKSGGLRRGDLVVIAGRRGEGISVLGLNIASKTALHGKKPNAVGVFSMKVPKGSLTIRIVASECSVDVLSLRSGYFSHDHWDNIITTLERLSEAPLFFDDAAKLSVRQIGTRARELAAQMRADGKSLELIIIDDLQHIRQASGRKGEAESLSALKRLAEALDVVIIVCSQIPKSNREDRFQTPLQISSLCQSTTPDLVVRLQRSDNYRNGCAAKLIMVRKRDGLTARVPLTFDRRYLRFENEASRRN